MIIGPLLMFYLMYLFFSLIFEDSRYKVLALVLMVISQIIGLISGIFYIKSIGPIGEILSILGFTIGFYGLQHKILSRVPLIIFISSLVAIQAIGYGFNINFLKYNSFLGGAIPTLLLVISGNEYRVNDKSPSV